MLNHHQQMQEKSQKTSHILLKSRWERFKIYISRFLQKWLPNQIKKAKIKGLSVHNYDLYALVSTKMQRMTIKL